MTVAKPTGDELVEMLAALANPLRLRIVAKLASGRDYVSHLAREIGISRPLLHMHLQRLEAAGLIVGHLELSEDGKAMKYYEVTDFSLHLSAPALAEAARTLTRSDPVKGPAHKEKPDELAQHDPDPRPGISGAFLPRRHRGELA